MDNLLRVENLTKYFDVKQGGFLEKPAKLKAVDDVSFTIKKGQTYGIVGESGCGKTTLGKCVVRLYKPDSGKIFLNVNGEEKDILSLSKEESFAARKRVQMIFQDPYASLNPVKNILSAFDEPLKAHGVKSAAERKEIAVNALESVNLQADYIYRFPHEFSGGQRQRICIAKALAMEPDLIVCDEPVSALDVSVQAQILNLMKKIQKEKGISYLFIAHDLSVVQYMSDMISVMYLGKIVETARAKELYEKKLHPYTQALLSAVPVPVWGAQKNRIILKGDVPSPINPPAGCRFNPRCFKCGDICKTQEPKTVNINDRHTVACHLYKEL